jgi:hypothetical protein
MVFPMPQRTRKAISFTLYFRPMKPQTVGTTAETACKKSTNRCLRNAQNERTNMTTTELENTLEQILDKQGLRATLEALQAVMDAKSNHIQENWQDRELASAYEKAGWAIAKMREKFSHLG